MENAIAEAGYVWLSNAVLLSQHNEVLALDIGPQKVERINRRKSPIDDLGIEGYLQNRSLKLRDTLAKHDAYKGVEIIVYEPVLRIMSKTQPENRA